MARRYLYGNESLSLETQQLGLKTDRTYTVAMDLRSKTFLTFVNLCNVGIERTYRRPSFLSFGTVTADAGRFRKLEGSLFMLGQNEKISLNTETAISA